LICGAGRNSYCGWDAIAGGVRRQGAIAANATIEVFAIIAQLRNLESREVKFSERRSQMVKEGKILSLPRKKSLPMENSCQILLPSNCYLQIGKIDS
jgi:hypothetical protein